jgi:hypothetical protein
MHIGVNNPDPRLKQAALCLVCLAVSRGAGAQSQVLIFNEEFNVPGLIDESKWITPIFEPMCNPAFLGRTALRNWLQKYGQDTLEVHADGYAVLPLDTYNRFAGVPGDSFLGSEIDTVPEFELDSGLGFKARVRIDPALPSGAVTSLFAYRREGECPSFVQDEIDFEFLSRLYVTPPVQVLTNMYISEPAGPGSPVVVDVPGVVFAGEWNTFRINWRPDSVQWLINGTLIHERCGTVPDGPMSIRLNFWVPDASFELAYDGAFQPVSTPQDNTRFEYLVDYVRVYRLLPDDPGCFGDVDANGTVGITDFLALLAAWGPCGCVCPADLDGDEEVGILDFLILLANWGPCS